MRGYRVFLEESGHSDAIVGNYTVPLSTNTSDFTGLKKFTTYSARVRAYSLFGEGPDGEVTASTDEDGEFLLFDMKVDTERKFNF